jgi:mannose-6-phosphate isomerase
VHRLDNTVQRYAWGDPDAIWTLLGVDPPGEPAAELWMGAHPVAPSRLAGTGRRLDEVVAADPVLALGASPAAAFGGRLPFLLKVLAAGEALSLQVHPDAGRARAGFEREEAEGVPLDAPTRTYRDPNHKPELVCAVSPFWARCGFRDLEVTRELMAALDEPTLAPLAERLAADGPPEPVLAQVVAWLLELGSDQSAALVQGAARAARRPGPDRFAAERCWTDHLAQQYPTDAGVVVALLLNLVELAPGEALFLGAGNLHCYLKGVGVEVMASSDNVVRGGLTAKHVDVAELLEVLDASPLPPQVQRPGGPVHTYRSPVPEFALTRIEAGEDPVERPAGPRIVVVLEGRVRLEAAGHGLELAAGQSAWVPAGDGALAVSGRGLAYEATVGAG